MAIQTSVGVRDNMSAAFKGITGAINTCLTTFMDLQSSTDEGLNPSQFAAVQTSIYEMNNAAKQFNDLLNEAGNEQEELNRKIQQGASGADGLAGKIKGMVGAYLGMKTIQGALNMSDEMTLTTARLDMMNDGMRTTLELQNMVMASAQRARGSYLDMASAVAKLGNNAGEAFGGNTEQIVAFTELVQKQFKIAGASGTEASNAMLQLTQALGSGVLRGDELNSIFEQAPNLIQTIADYMGVSIGEIRNLASEGQITADIVKNAMFSASDDINAKFDAMPKTWGDVWTDMQNQALIKFQPILQKLNDIANSDRFKSTFNGLMNGLAVVAKLATGTIDILVKGASFVKNNWSLIAPIFWGIATAVGAYVAIQTVSNALTGLMAIAEGLHAAAKFLTTEATWAETTAQLGLNDAMYACPLAWIIALLAALVIAIIAVCNWIAKSTKTANTWFGVMMGGIFVVGAAFKNFGMLVANIGLGIWGALGACADNIGIAFKNTIAGVKGWFYSLLATVLEVVEGTCKALNKIPFVEIDYKGIADKADDYAAKSAEAYGSMEDFKSIGDAFDKGFDTYDAFSDGWASDAYAAGAKWGDGVSNKVSGLFSVKGLDGGFGDTSGYSGGYGSQLDGINDGVGSTADSASAIKDSLDVTEDNLKWMKDIAEREIIDRTIYRDISVNLGGVNNTVNNMSDLDGVADYLGTVISEQMYLSAEGAHA